MSYAEEYVGSPEVTLHHAEVQAPQLIQRETVASAHAYMIRLLQLGAMEGALGELDINPSLKQVIEAMHHVLAGGEVEITLHGAGEPQVVEELNTRLAQTTMQINELNRRAGYSVLPTC